MSAPELLLTLVTSRRCPKPPATMRERAIANVWERYVEPLRYLPEADFEDFWEQACRLEAAVASFGLGCTWLVTGHGATARRLSDQQVRSVDELDRLPRYGMQAEPLPFADAHDPEWDAGNYMGDAAFRRNAGRRLAWCTSDCSGEVDVVDVLTEWARDGVRRAVVKTRRTKHGLWFIDLPASGVREEVEAVVNDVMEFSLYSMGGRPEAFLAQEWVPMRFEYRVFVVGHQAVTGAGCVEEFTPLDSWAIFDTRVRERRHEGRAYEVTAQPEVVGRLVEFARRVIDELRAERPEVRDYTLDVAIGPDGPLVIERNGLLNSGLYASQPQCVTDALAADRIGHPTPTPAPHRLEESA